MTSSIPPMHRPIKDLPRSFGAKRRVHQGSALYARSESHSRTASRDTGSRTTEGDLSNQNTSEPESTTSISAPSTPSHAALDSLPMITVEFPKGDNLVAAEAEEGSATTFKFTNLPRIARTDLLMDPLAAARVVLNYSTRAQQVLSQQAQTLTKATSTLESASIANVMTDYSALYNSVKHAETNAIQPNGAQPLSVSTAPAQSQNAFSMARLQAQQDDEECGPELTVYEHSVNKKKRKSGRVTYMDSSGAGTDGYRTTGKGDCSWYCGDDGDYPQEEDPSGNFANGVQDEYPQEQEAPPPPPRMVYPPPHLSHSARLLRRMRQAVTAKVRFERYQRREKAAAAALEASQASANGGPNGDPGKDGKGDLVADKKPQRRATKAESRAKVRGGGSQKISLAALKAKLAEEQQGAGAGDAVSTAGKNSQGKGSGAKGMDRGGPALEQVSEETARTSTPPPPPPPPERVTVRPPTCAFTFTSASPIASRLVAMRAEVEMLQSKLSDSLRPVDEAVAAAADVLTRLDAGEDMANVHVEVAAALTAARTNLEAIPSPSGVAGAGRKALPAGQASTLSQVPAIPSAAVTQQAHNTSSFEPQPAPVTSSAPEQSLQPQPATTTPPQAPKISRRKKANMNNIHHRTNYVPSRMPSDPPPVARGPTKNVSSVTNWEQPPGLDHPTTTCSLFANEWLCLFCEYELLYGELPSMVRACRRRKKLVGARKRAQDRAHRAAGGEVGEADGAEQGSQSTDKKKKKGKKKGSKKEEEHSHECCTCTCGKENPAEWEPNAPFHHAATAPASGTDHHYAIADTAPPHADAADGGTYQQYGDDDCDTCRAGVIEEVAAENQIIELPDAPASPLQT
ncbi:unnamed protein product [Tilletia controversa]|uniref:Uncharacterized protein n=3 Tax=Tilletia TaxID=13289 RepID=A0A8X7T0N7_9BASI|nr:hypothetical protein CF335_g2623 [Tilletia laevis]KAE8254416.1 hypothetical protein A4X06_0g917 [Tilletia controversa]CAD6893471.1 unnamed protein product [Tilletia caries]CAD6896477.1 unnamed protein product [Tilletia laevis]CAD6910209.1 unnamed protein product [Tilletia caries]